MSKALFTLLAGVAMLGLVGAANAQPLQLSDQQMDNVTAGAAAEGVGEGVAMGTLLAGVNATIATAVAGPNAAATGIILSVGASFAPGPASGAASVLQIALTSP